MKKTWIKIKRGLLEPKHRQKLGNALFLYLFILDKVNWDDGIIHEWTDESASEELEMPLSTLRDQRRRLEDELYIQTRKKQYCLEITVTNWTNPREYSGQVYNQIESDENPILSEEFQSYTQSDTQSDTQSSEKVSLLHRISHNHIINTSYSGKESRILVEPNLEPCDIDGIPDSWKEEQGSLRKKKTVSFEERSLAQYFSEYTGLKLPRLETKRDYGAAQVTWWKPIRAMLYEVDDKLEVAKDIMTFTIDKMKKDRLSYSSPQSILKMYLAQIALENGG